MSWSRACKGIKGRNALLARVEHQRAVGKRRPADAHGWLLGQDLALDEGSVGILGAPIGRSGCPGRNATGLAQSSRTKYALDAAELVRTLTIEPLARPLSLSALLGRVMDRQ